MINKLTDIAVVSYSNTWPFLYGIEHYDDAKKIFNPIIDFPAQCAQRVISGGINLGLIPVGALLSLNSCKIITDFCIGANSQVATVKLFSNVPISDAKTIVLDYQSITSVFLAKILVTYFWRLKVDFELLMPQHDVGSIPLESAVLIIGDRCFQLDKQYQYSIDLAQEWNKFTGLPFTFAVWVAKSSVPDSTIGILQSALKWGIANIDKAVEHYNRAAIFDSIDIKRYLTANIKYELNGARRKAIDIFLNYASMLPK